MRAETVINTLLNAAPGVTALVDELRAAGFEIDERPGLGYRLLAAPDRLIAADLHSRLGNCALVREIVVFEETDSTNDQAANLGRNGAASGVQRSSGVAKCPAIAVAAATTGETR